MLGGKHNVREIGKSIKLEREEEPVRENEE